MKTRGRQRKSCEIRDDGFRGYVDGDWPLLLVLDSHLPQRACPNFLLQQTGPASSKQAFGPLSFHYSSQQRPTVLSGVAVGSGWQSYVAYINLGCYYLIGVPLGFIMGWIFNQGVMGVWAGMIFGGTAVQTLILAVITIRCDWDKEAEKATMHVKKCQTGPEIAIFRTEHLQPTECFKKI
ncbi:unnamed protein product [Thlaspi arvense]|uniref:Protein DETOXIFICATION n=1 Tax=Thlaspi arvense TaxID=13288 RepID=A0AAU9RHN3_THLAR|nr:unnamed protein product [Thlaspi arvense]